MRRPHAPARRPILLLTMTLAALPRVAEHGGASSVFPAGEWERASNTEALGGSAAGLSAFRTMLAGGQTSAAMVIVGGRVLLEYGNTAETSYLASARKSIISMLYGKYVEDGTVRLDATLRTLGIDDLGGLLPSELDATVGDLLAARSGVYHPAANFGDASDRAPARGSQKHGEYFLYNNWDFNALGAVLEKVTGRSVYDVFSDDIAVSIGLQDWSTRPGAYAAAVRNDTGKSRFPAHHFVLSTRDMARLGYLMLRGGRWRDRQVIPAWWVARSTSIVTSAREVARTSPFVPGLGYGYLWWVFDPAAHHGTALDGAFTASGAFGQYITIVPRLDMVIAHKTVAPSTRNVTSEAYFGTILPRALTLVSSR